MYTPQSTELLVAKKKIYSLLVNKSNDELTNAELDLMFVLSRDTQIQAYLQQKLVNIKYEQAL